MRDRNSPFALVTKPVAGLRRLLGAVEGKLHSQVEREDCLDGGWGRTWDLIEVLTGVQAQLLSALFWNWKLRKKRGMLADAARRLALRARFGGLAGLERWEGKTKLPHSVIPAPEPGPRAGECAGTEIGERGPGSWAGDAGKRDLFRLARVRPSSNSMAKSPRLTRGLPRGAERVAYHDGGPASSLRSCGNLRRDYQIEVWPVELMWRRERRARFSSRIACGRTWGRWQRRGGFAERSVETYQTRFEPRVRGSPQHLRMRTVA